MEKAFNSVGEVIKGTYLKNATVKISRTIKLAFLNIIDDTFLKIKNN